MRFDGSLLLTLLKTCAGTTRAPQPTCTRPSSSPVLRPPVGPVRRITSFQLTGRACAAILYSKDASPARRAGCKTNMAKRWAKRSTDYPSATHAKRSHSGSAGAGAMLGEFGSSLAMGSAAVLPDTVNAVGGTVTAVSGLVSAIKGGHHRRDLQAVRELVVRWAAAEAEAEAAAWAEVCPDPEACASGEDLDF